MDIYSPPKIEKICSQSFFVQQILESINISWMFNIFWRCSNRCNTRGKHPQGYVQDKYPESHKIDRTFVLFTAKRNRHFPSVESLKTQRRTKLLLKCSFTSICNSTSHKQLSNKGTLKNQPINQQTNKQQTCKTF